MLPNSHRHNTSNRIPIQYLRGSTQGQGDGDETGHAFIYTLSSQRSRQRGWPCLLPSLPDLPLHARCPAKYVGMGRKDANRIVRVRPSRFRHTAVTGRRARSAGAGLRRASPCCLSHRRRPPAQGPSPPARGTRRGHGLRRRRGGWQPSERAREGLRAGGDPGGAKSGGREQGLTSARAHQRPSAPPAAHPLRLHQCACAGRTASLRRAVRLRARRARARCLRRGGAGRGGGGMGSGSVREGSRWFCGGGSEGRVE